MRPRKPTSCRFVNLAIKEGPEPKKPRQWTIIHTLENTEANYEALVQERNAINYGDTGRWVDRSMIISTVHDPREGGQPPIRQERRSRIRATRNMIGRLLRLGAIREVTNEDQTQVDEAIKVERLKRLEVKDV